MESSGESFQLNQFSTNCSQDLMGNSMCQDLREVYGEKSGWKTPKAVIRLSGGHLKPKSFADVVDGRFALSPTRRVESRSPI